MAKISIKLKRIYEKSEKTDGFRILVDRLWPRGVSKEHAHLDLWLKDIAPSTQLRKWFNHDVEKWAGFKNRYFREIAQNPAMEEFKKVLTQHPQVTLLFAAKDEEHNEAVILKEYISK